MQVETWSDFALLIVCVYSAQRAHTPSHSLLLSHNQKPLSKHIFCHVEKGAGKVSKLSSSNFVCCEIGVERAGARGMLKWP